MLQVGSIILLFCAATILAVQIGRLSGKKWTLGFFCGLTILLSINMPKFIPQLINNRLYQTLFSDGIAGIIAIIPCLPKLSRANTRYLVVGFLIISLMRSSLMPAACSFFNKNELAGLPPQVDGDGVYLQTTGYTCGPAALATVLNAYGIKDSEGGIALATGCNSYSGTRSLDLVNYINSRYGYALSARYLYVDEIESLIKMNGIFIAEVRASAFTDHFVAIMNVTEDTLTVADPAYGKFETKIDGFAREWRHKIIVVQKKES